MNKLEVRAMLLGHVLSGSMAEYLQLLKNGRQEDQATEMVTDLAIQIVDKAMEKMEIVGKGKGYGEGGYGEGGYGT